MNFLLVGRSNVGKSSIFNILTREKSNIIHNERWTTRDWHKGNIPSSKNYYIYDTPGIVINSKKDDEKRAITIIKSLISKIDIFLFVVDYKFLNNVEDKSILDWIRKFNKEIILLVNKKDNNKIYLKSDSYNHGIKNIFFLSCSHKIGFDEFRKFIDKSYSVKSTKKKNKLNNINYHDFSIAIFGKPNAGKSTFLNTFLGYERSLTSVKAGTTSDYVYENIIYRSKNIRIFDTAGIGRKSRIINKSINHYSINKTLKKIKSVDVSIILIDSSLDLDRQDKRIIDLVSKQSKSLILVFNKIDLIKDKFQFKKDIAKKLKFSLHQLRNIKIFFISSFLKKQVSQVINYINKNLLENEFNLDTSKINIWLKKCTNTHPHPLIAHKKVNFKYAVKIKDKPIIIKIFCNNSNKIKKSYIGYLKNNFNSYFKIENQRIKFIFNKSQNPFN